MNSKDSTTRVTQKNRSLISGVATGAGSIFASAVCAKVPFASRTAHNSGKHANTICRHSKLDVKMIMKINIIIILSFIWISNQVKTQTGWEKQTSGTYNSLRSVFFSDSSIGTTVGDSGTILRTNNGGQLWTKQYSGISEILNCVFFTDSLTGTVVGGHNFPDYSGLILRTSDAGTTWTTAITLADNVAGLTFINSSIGYAVGSRGTILKTTDGGITWGRQINYAPNFLFSICFISPDTGIAVGLVGKILKTTDGGINWIDQPSGTEANLYSVSLLNTQLGVSVGYGGIILRTTDGGSNWTNRSTGSSTFLFGVVLKNDSDGFAVGDNGRILHTSDGGNTWDVQSSGTTNGLASLSFVSPFLGTVVGTTGTILHTMTGGVVTAVPYSPDRTNFTREFSLDQNYPNPFNPTTLIKFSVPFQSHVSLRIYNLAGVEIASLLDTQKVQGSYSISWSAENLPTGIYLCKLQVGHSMKVRKLILLK